MPNAFPTLFSSIRIGPRTVKNRICLSAHADSLAEVIRRALAVYDFLWSESAQGGKLVVKGKQGEKELVLL